MANEEKIFKNKQYSIRIKNASINEDLNYIANSFNAEKMSTVLEEALRLGAKQLRNALEVAEKSAEEGGDMEKVLTRAIEKGDVKAFSRLSVLGKLEEKLESFDFMLKEMSKRIDASLFNDLIMKWLLRSVFNGMVCEWQAQGLDDIDEIREKLDYVKLESGAFNKTPQVLDDFEKNYAETQYQSTEKMKKANLKKEIEEETEDSEE